MKSIILIVGTVLLSALLFSCSVTKGTKALEQLHQFTGNWTGKGKLYTAPNTQGNPWTATVNYKGAYDDVLVEKKEVITIGDAEQIATLSFLGWDWENNNPTILSVGNDGKGARKHAMSIVEDKTYQFTRTIKNDLGQTVVEQTTTKLMNDTYTVTTNTTIDGGTSFVSFEGTYSRTSAYKTWLI